MTWCLLDGCGSLVPKNSVQNRQLQNSFVEFPVPLPAGRTKLGRRERGRACRTPCTGYQRGMSFDGSR